jgi:phosphate transport system protein
MVRAVTQDPIQQSVVRLFARVTEALAKATWALLNADMALGRSVVEGDAAIDEEVRQVENLLWAEVDAPGTGQAIRYLVRMLLVIPELERSADLAEHIAQRAVTNVGVDMTPVSRGIVQRMSEVAIEMWRATADAYVDGAAEDLELHETDEELDILHDRLTSEVAAGAMEPSVAAQVTLLARFYERIGDHAVNLSRRVSSP